MHLKKGNDFYFVNDANLVGDETQCATTYLKALVKVGDRLFVDDGALSFLVEERMEDRIRTKIECDGILQSNKGINFPQNFIHDLPALSEKDKNDIRFAIQQQVDFVAVACLRDKTDVEALRMYLGNSDIKIIAAIENQRGMDNFEAILRYSDGICIDRGYLGAEMDLELVVIAQKKMINLANRFGKSIFISNQILESMVHHYRPTRSEAAGNQN